MTSEPKLDGHRVLVVEDEYYIATDAARALRGAGADVIGPCPSEDAASAEVERQRPDAVIVDINLGGGPSFKLADSLKERGIPFVFVTGYDQDVIPPQFDEVERLQKPVELRQMIEVVSRLVQPVA
jgi:DNA-binding response OmpR family regulator